MKIKFKKVKGFSFKSFRTKLTLILLVLTIIPTIAVGALSYYSAYDILKDNLSTNILSSLKAQNSQLDNFFGEMKLRVSRFSEEPHLIEYGTYVANNDFDNPEFQHSQDLVNSMIKNNQSNNNNIMFVYFASMDKKMHIYPEADLGADYDPTIRPWYIDAIKVPGKTVMTKPYVDAATGDLIITVSQAIKNNDQLIGVVGFDINFKTFIKEFSKIKIGKFGYAAIVGTDGTMLSHSDKSLIGTDIMIKLGLWDKIKNSNNSESGIIEY
jgi:methyl-accepting chemotaxis protein